MKIEAGKFYRNADGEKVGPMRCDYIYNDYFGSIGSFQPDGKSTAGRDPDLIAEWTDENNGPDTIQNLDLKVGDVAECVVSAGYANFTKGETYKCKEDGSLDNNYGAGYDVSVSIFTVVSRATENPKPFGELSDQEKGELLLAHHDGKRIEVCGCEVFNPQWYSWEIYRIAPEPTRVTGTVEVDADGKPDFNTWELT